MLRRISEKIIGKAVVVFIVIIAGNIISLVIPGFDFPFCRAEETGLGYGSPDVTEMGLEELMKIKITSAAKKPQELTETAAAVFVITQEDIRRSGATGIPEILRMAPGIQVAVIDANKWAISSRGFNGRFANKLLVLIDGRSVYTPLFSGVYWDVQDTMLEDIERIEVIRGPGATLWGANAVNGVINIITKNSKDTLGGLVSTGAGTEEKWFGSVRYGVKINDNIYFRLYAKYFDRDDFVDSSGRDAADRWHMLRSGFRIDMKKSSEDSLTFQGDLYEGKTGETFTVASLNPPYALTYNDKDKISGGNLLARWKHVLSGSSEMYLHMYYDRTDRKDPAILDEKRDIADIDFQHRFSLTDMHEIMWGLGYRFTADRIADTQSVSFVSHKSRDDLFSAFIQDDITLVKDRLHLVLGSKLEHNDYTGFEIQPNMRLLWMPDKKHTLWASVARAVRTPSRAENDVRINNEVIPPADQNSLPALTIIYGSHSLDSEELISYEAGYKLKASEKMFIDFTVFYNIYDNLVSAAAGAPFTETAPLPVHVVVPLKENNEMEGKTYGAEISYDLQATEWWRLQASYTYLEMDLRDNTDASDNAEGQNPHNQLSLMSSMNLFRDFEFDLWFRFVDELPSIDIKSYFTCDARFSWNPVKNLELSLTGRNLFDNHHPEFKPEILNTLHTEVERSVYGKVTWRF